MTTTMLVVRKRALHEAELRRHDGPPLADGQVRVQIARFAFTANNITYAAFGDAMAYWQFYPVPGADGQPSPEAAADWGCIPVWGFATVVQSLHPGVAVGERLYGYWPMASHAVLAPTRLGEQGFADGAPHRASLHAVYNQVQRVNRDPFYTADSEDLQALLRPLYLTAWLIDDFLADNAWFGAAADPAHKPVLLLSSASSKTAWSTAAQLAARAEVEVVGLTSPGNLAYCRSLGVYHRVLAYDDLASLDADSPCLYVDFAGNAALRAAIHQRFGRLAYDCSIGGTHVEQLGSARDLPGPKATLFFAPAQVKKRHADWGAAGFGERLVGAWHAYRQQVAAASPPFMSVVPRPTRRVRPVSSTVRRTRYGSPVQLGPAGTTSEWPRNIRPGPVAASGSQVAVTLGRPGATSSVSATRPRSAAAPASTAAAAASEPPGFSLGASTSAQVSRSISPASMSSGTRCASTRLPVTSASASASSFVTAISGTTTRRSVRTCRGAGTPPSFSNT